jgi:four helix bundle protein
MYQSEKYNLEKRTQDFGIRIVQCCQQIDRNPINDPLIKQIVRSGTSIGANYQEANGASSKKDFTNKISICKKEAKETYHWLVILKSANSMVKSEIEKLQDECHQLVLIFSKIHSSCKIKN